MLPADREDHSSAAGFDRDQELEGEGTPEVTDANAGRFVRYQFTPQFLRLKTVGAT